MSGRKSDTLIYVVDDEPVLLELAEACLAPTSCRLRKFNNPAAAWKSFSTESSKPALLMTDYAMGRMTGLELAALCKQAHPELKVLLVSGTAGPEVIKGMPVKVDLFLAKPYQPRQLLSAVQSLLPA